MRQPGFSLRSNLVIFALGALLIAGLGASPGAAKKKPPPSRTVSGEVMDEANHPISGATVELTDLNTGKQLSIFTQAGGRYVFSGLKPLHDYEVRATYQGSESETRKVSSLNDENRVVLNLIVSSASAAKP